MSIRELETAISKLPPDQLAALDEWFDDYRADEWDRQIEADARAGKLDSLVSEARSDIAAGRAAEASATRDLVQGGFGGAKGLIRIAPDFDEPLEEFDS